MAGFSLAELFVDIKADDEAFKGAMERVKQSCESVHSKFKQLSVAAAAIFAGAVATIGGFAAEALKAEKAAGNLRFALEGVGDSAGLEKVEESVKSLQGMTIFSKDELENAAAMATHLGVTSDEMDTVLKAGIGLSKFFDNDLKSGIDAASKALQGNYRDLRSVIPQMKEMSGDQLQKYVQQMAAAGFGEAQRDLSLFGGQIKRLQNVFTEAAGQIGSAFLPYINKLVSGLQLVANWFQGLSEHTRNLIAGITLAVAAVAGIVAVLPFVAAAFAALISPVGLAVAAVAGIVAALMYFGVSLQDIVTVVVGVSKTIVAVLVEAGAVVATVMRAIVQGVVDGVLDIAQIIGYLFSDSLMDKAAGWKDSADKTFDKIQDAIQKVGDIGANIEQTPTADIVDRIKGFWDKVQDSMKKGINDVALGGLNFQPEKPLGKDKAIKPVSAEESFKNAITRFAIGEAFGNGSLQDPEVEAKKQALEEQKKATAIAAKQFEEAKKHTEKLENIAKSLLDVGIYPF